MLERLKSCGSVEDMTSLGVQLTDGKSMQKLQRDIVKARLVFDSENYWGPDYIDRFTVQELMEFTEKETGSMYILHLLQILQKCCPVLTADIKRLLSKTTR